MSLSTQRLEGFTICKSVTAARRILELKFCFNSAMAMGIYDGGKKESSVILYEIIFSVCRREQQRKFDKRGKMTDGVKLLTSKLI